ncbi:hypothetical protein QEH42_gp213 [Microbacterium phage Pumpernickel]|uniref:Uncharacterized protein n=1 Tax=Microbacterium phage Pumpernickel TaxID=2885983 RepID=A0AAE8Y7B8_9CAUD|nr:hypothetical protein QEH42_gp213 [Microbacterium phage Pumpernickel]UDL16005.1 hypothetical protein SEA_PUMPERNICKEL_255 [Microbacterium phage Pumpernickel]
MTKYYYETDYIYNVFGADEHLVVSLWKETKNGKKVKWVAEWKWSTFLSDSWAWSRAEKRIRKLRATYDAEPM